MKGRWITALSKSFEGCCPDDPTLVACLIGQHFRYGRVWIFSQHTGGRSSNRDESSFLTSLGTLHPIPAKGINPMPSSKPSSAILLGSLRVDLDDEIRPFPLFRCLV